MYIYIRIYAYVYIHIDIYVYVHHSIDHSIDIYIHISASIYMYVYVYMYIYTYISIYLKIMKKNASDHRNPMKKNASDLWKPGLNVGDPFQTCDGPILCLATHMVDEDKQIWNSETTVKKYTKNVQKKLPVFIDFFERSVWELKKKKKWQDMNVTESRIQTKCRPQRIVKM